MKKLGILLLMIITMISLTGCEKSKEKTDAIKFKEEYESLNGTKSSSGKTIRTLSIPEDNPFIYATADEIVEKMDKKETFVVYFGFAKCPWCRSMLEQFIKSAKDNNIDKIYYVDVYDIRDLYELDKDNKPVEKESGTESYKTLIKTMADVLSDYILTMDSGEEVPTGEKRIYAPNVVAVVNGEAEQMVEGIAEGLEDPYSKLTEEMKSSSYNSFKCLWECLGKEANVCQKNAC